VTSTINVLAQGHVSCHRDINQNTQDKKNKRRHTYKNITGKTRRKKIMIANHTPGKKKQHDQN
jgi:hypothetical protein